MYLPLRTIFCLSLISISLHAECLYGQTKATTNDVVSTQEKTVKSSVKSQKEIDELNDKAQELLTDYKITNIEIDNLKIYNRQLEKVIQSQLDEMESIKKQIKSIETTNQRIVPLMVKMLETIENFISLDIPFLMNERTTRIKRIKETMNQANISVSEKYRRIMEAYQIESEYGRSIEAYNETITLDGSNKTVEFLRIGRIALLYRTLDGKQAKFWNHKQKTWEQLDSSFNKAIRDGIKIAKKQSAPNLLTLPLQTPEEI